MRASILKSNIAFLQALPKRGYRFVRRISLEGLHRLYAWVILIPYLRSTGGISGRISMKPAFNSLVIFDHHTLYKVSLSKKSTIELEYGNFEKIRRDCPDLLEIIPGYQLKKGPFAFCLSMTYYNPVNIEDSREMAPSIYKIMLGCGSPARKLDISDSDELQAGLKLIANVYGNSVSLLIKQIVTSFLNSGEYRVGFAHGDFHPRNILADRHGKPKLIDLDCVRFQGIQDFDALYFVLEMEWSKSGKPWYETIVNYLKGDIPSSARAVFKKFGIDYSYGLAISYIIDRIGQEYRKYDLLFPKKQLDPIVDQILKFGRAAIKAERP